jgi:hypothetical protein
MEAIIRVVSEEGPAVITLRISLGRTGPTGTCWETRAGESCCSVCIHRSFLQLGINVRWWKVIGSLGGTSHSDALFSSIRIRSKDGVRPFHMRSDGGRD